MFVSISSKVLNMPRSLTDLSNTVEEDSNSKPILGVSCFGTDKLVKTLKSHEENLLKTNSFRNSVNPLFQFVKKTSLLEFLAFSVLKSLALGQILENTIPCLVHASCKCCKLIDNPVTEINGCPVS